MDEINTCILGMFIGICLSGLIIFLAHGTVINLDHLGEKLCNKSGFKYTEGSYILDEEKLPVFTCKGELDKSEQKILKIG